MEYESFLKLAQHKPLIRTKDFPDEGGSFLVQLNRWVKAGKLIQLKRGTYVLCELYQKKPWNQFYISNNLVWPSYISLEKALEYWGLIPESVVHLTAITTKRPQVVQTAIGTFSYKHIQASLFWGYQSITQSGLVYFMARPEKALLDVFYFHLEQITDEYIVGLRLQNTEILDQNILTQMAKKFEKPKIMKACDKLLDFIVSREKDFKTL